MMRKPLITIAVIAAAASVAACDREPEQATLSIEAFEAELAALRTETFHHAGGESLDLDALIERIPPFVTISYEEVSADADRGAAIISNVRISPADMPDVGVSIDELSVWDFNQDLVIARLNGEQMDNGGPIARRIEADTIAVFGLEAFINPVMEAYTSGVEGVLDDVDPALADNPAMDLSMEIHDYEFSIARLVIDEPSLRPWAINPVELGPEHAEWADVMPFAQIYAAASRSFAAKTLAGYDMTAQMSYTAATTEDASIDVGVDSFGYRGLSGGDLDLGVIRNLGYGIDATFLPVSAAASPDLAPNAPIPMAMDASIGRYTMEGLRTDNLWKALAMGEWPDRSQTDFMSLGVWRVENEIVTINDLELLSLRAGEVDMSGFHWLAPTQIGFEVDGLAYNIPALIKFVENLDPSFSETDPQTMAILDSVLKVLSKHNLEAPALDFAFRWTWDAQSGDAQIYLAEGIEDQIRFDLTTRGRLPDFDSVSAMVPNEIEDANTAGLMALFAGVSQFNEARAHLVDEGGLDTGFAVTADLMKVLAAENPDMAMFERASPEQLRTMATGGVHMGAIAIQEDFPGAAKLMTPFAKFVGEGGSLEARIAPEIPVDFAEVQRLQTIAVNDPNDILDELGVVVEHTPSPGSDN